MIRRDDVDWKGTNNRKRLNEWNNANIRAINENGLKQMR